jgi:hypothetical protein
MNHRFKLNRLYSLLRLVSGIILILLGIIITPLPIPIGLLLIFIGFMVVAYDSVFLKQKIRNLRKRHPRFSDRLKKLEIYTFFIIRDVLKNTDPSQAEDSD